jgi:hypothetical protein
MDNIKKDEAATFCCVRCGLTGKKKMFLKEKAALGRWEWLFTITLQSW